MKYEYAVLRIMSIQIHYIICCVHYINQSEIIIVITASSKGFLAYTRVIQPKLTCSFRDSYYDWNGEHVPHLCACDCKHIHRSVYLHYIEIENVCIILYKRINRNSLLDSLNRWTSVRIFRSYSRMSLMFWWCIFFVIFWEKVLSTAYTWGRLQYISPIEYSV